MKDWIQRWLDIGKPSKRDFEELAAAAVTSLADAQKAHISDLRVLIDKGHEREAQLAGMVQRALEHQFYRSAVVGKPIENRISPSIPADAMTDVAVFDEKADAEQVAQQERELESLINEQNEKGVNKVA